MKHTAALVSLAIGIFSPAASLAANWDIDQAHSIATFSVRHMMVSNVRGAFGGIKGTVEFDEKNPAKSKVDISIDVSTIDTRDAKRDRHLKSAAFFDTAKHPKMTFKSKRITKNGKGWKVVGDLTIRGVKKEVTLDAEVSKAMKSLSGKTVVGVHATIKINRQDFGVSWNKTLDAGGILVSNEVKITIDLELVKNTKGDTADE